MRQLSKLISVVDNMIRKTFVMAASDLLAAQKSVFQKQNKVIQKKI
jgi:hypothetical protein